MEWAGLMDRTLCRCLVAGAVMAAVATPTSARADRGGQKQHTEFDRRNFARPVTIDNRWLPLVPGTEFVFEGRLRVAEGDIPHRVVLTVTDLTKVIDGVRTLVIWDRDFDDGELVEEEIAFFAQDKDGNVWLLGEYPEEHEDGETSAPSTWLAGHQDAVAGVAMRVNPRTKTSSYFQGIAPEAEFIDKARVSKTNQKTCVRVECRKNVLVIDEWDPTQQPQDGHQLKFHAPSVGVVRVEPRGGEQQETLVLTTFRRLGDKGLAEARERALELDERAYDLAPDVFRSTPHSEVLDEES